MSTVRSSRRSCTGSGRGLPGVTYPGTSDRGRRCGSDTAASPGTAPETGFTALLVQADGLGEIDWNVSVDSTINRAHPHGTNLTGDAGGHCRITRICCSNRLTSRSAAPAAGWARRCTTSATARGARWYCCSAPGPANDSPMFPSLMDAIRVPRSGPGRPRTRPNAVLADKGYSSRGNRALLGSRGIKTVIGVPSYQNRAPQALEIIKVAARPR